MLQINQSTVVEDSTQNPKMKGSNPVTGDRKCHPKNKICYSLLWINQSIVMEDSTLNLEMKGSNPATGDRKCRQKIKYNISSYELTKEWGISMFNVDDSNIA